MVSIYLLLVNLVPLLIATAVQAQPAIPDNSNPENDFPQQQELDPLPDTFPQPEDHPTLEQPTPVTPSGDAPPSSFQVDEIQVLGNTILDAEIQALVEPLEGQEVTFADLLTLRTAITQLYIDNGYISSGAFIPSNQVLEDGIVQIQIVEGAIEQVQINGLGRLREGYIRSRVSRATKAPLNVQRLEEALQLLQVDPLLQRVDAELTAGSGPGLNILILDLAEADPFFANLSTDNYRSPSIGSLQGNANVSYGNVLGFGDSLSASYSLTDGLDSYNVGYTVPINGLDGSLELRYQNSESEIVEDQLRDAGIRSESKTFSFNYRQPLTRSVSNEFALSLGFDFRESRSFILDDIPFSFSIGPEDGVSKVRAIRFAQDWVNRDINSVLAVRSQFNIGLDTFDATNNNTGTDGQFFSWLGQFQWVEQFSAGQLLVTRVNAQLTPDSLLPLERFSVGGIGTVRGYTQNQLVTDNAITASTEFRFPIGPNLQLTPFIDAGGGWNNKTPDPDPGFLIGTGLGLRWQPSNIVNVRLDYGIPVISSGDEGNSLQENGFYFSVNLQPFE
ncbi:ShlB/FhaC/HecB family hemolysin secretion/activation protein [Leptolyngbyaceae cyanobacterium CCMR0081]|uniref:ShlB/FhaC/HecB family hemolysin secretion/activation protein n=2 Tax=Adonisia TaxID=2950183 RepID=A0A6M0RQC9_9CYAN|nr:ShlB/FhaC/HecB family hemolysin secretion/activation protein [Adonisia turfae CCMR0081]